MVTKTNVKKEKDVLKTWFTASAAKSIHLQPRYPKISKKVKKLLP